MLIFKINHLIIIYFLVCIHRTMDEEIKTRAKSRNLYENLEKKLIFIKCERLELNHANFA